jgi:hAT family C-terminal dimerisation region
LNVALNESQWAQLPTFLSQSMPLSETAGPERSPIEPELDTYLKVLPVSSGVDINILGYWKSQEKVFPLLSKFARRYFGIPVKLGTTFFLLRVMSLLRIAL